MPNMTVNTESPMETFATISTTGIGDPVTSTLGFTVKSSKN